MKLFLKKNVDNSRNYRTRELLIICFFSCSIENNSTTAILDILIKFILKYKIYLPIYYLSPSPFLTPPMVSYS